VIFDETGRALVPVLVCQGDSEAHVAVSYLASVGIAARVNSEVPQELLPLSVDILGRVQVLVREDQAEQAREILEERLRSSAQTEEED
jgi:hypothetical protein